jgi:itaconyl-CoA hydratase
MNFSLWDMTTALTTRTLGRVVANLGWTGIELPRPVRRQQHLSAPGR